MTPRMHFISGLPRAGSTLLAAILRQNPRLHAAMTSPVGELFRLNLSALGRGRDVGIFLDEQQKKDLLAAIVDCYYRPHTDKAVILDTNRGWTAHLAALLSLYPEAKVICCVRNVAWVLDSIERLIRRNAFDSSRIFQSDTERATVFSRVAALTNRERMVGYAWSAAKEAYYGEHSRSLLIVEYDVLAQQPAPTLERIYAFLDEPPFVHDLDNVDYAEPDFDAFAQTPGLHTVRRKVTFEPRQTVLPPELFANFVGLSFWRDPQGSAATRITMPDEQPSAGAGGASALG